MYSASEKWKNNYYLYKFLMASVNFNSSIINALNSQADPLADKIYLPIFYFILYNKGNLNQK